MAPFVRNSLLGLMRVTSQLILQHADTILPCADFFNPGWEIEIGTSQGVSVQLQLCVTCGICGANFA
jgi:hypothetical protein